MIPHAAVTSDFIVGFCGETEADFQQTVELVREARFKNSFIFKYSGRPGTTAARRYPDDVPEAVKRRRNNELLAVQDAICLEDNQPLLGQTVEVLVEGPSKVAKRRARGQGSGVGGQGPAADLTGKTAVQLVGRTTRDQIVVFDGPQRLAGSILPVVIEQVDAFTLTGRLTAAAS
jgi:tRNA-2-methylthio-N6-dimethylallyladenosine synthase